MTFNVGDEVVCVVGDAFRGLLGGSKYVIVSVDRDMWVDVECANGKVITGCAITRFLLAIDSSTSAVVADSILAPPTWAASMPVEPEKELTQEEKLIQYRISVRKMLTGG